MGSKAAITAAIVFGLAAVTAQAETRSGDAVKGKAGAKVCGVCHNLEVGQGNKLGPPLWGVVGRQKASSPGFNYSSAMKAKGGKWTLQDIDAYIANPRDYVSGTTMTFAGVADAARRADIIAFLSTLSEHASER